MKWIVDFYEKENGDVPVMEFLESLPTKHKAKAQKSIDLLEEYGMGLKEPYVKHITGKEYKGLSELRIKFASDISRIFYFMPVGTKLILLHGFLKKTQKTPKRELDTAKKYMIDHLRRREK